MNKQREIVELSSKEYEDLTYSQYDKKTGELFCDTYTPLGLFVCRNYMGEWNAINNEDGRGIHNVFARREDAEKWLRKNTSDS